MNSIVQRMFLRVDSRWIFSLALLALVSAFLGSILRVRRAPEPLAFSPQKPAVDSPSAGELAGMTAAPPLRYRPPVEGNPFDSPALRQWLVSRQAPVVVPDPPVVETQVVVEASAPVPDEDPPASEPKDPVVPVVFKGELQRPDGSRFGLVAWEGGSSDHLLRAGEEWQGFRIQAIHRQHMILSRESHTFTLKRGIPQPLEIEP